MKIKILMEEKILNFEMLLPPNNFGNINSYIINYLNENKNIFNSEKNGCILKILELKDISNKISITTGEIIINVKCKVKTINPKPGLKLKSKINLILDTGILTEYKGIKIWIPENKLERKNDKFFFDEKELKKDAKINIIIDIIRYDKKIFSCIGSCTS